MNKKALVAGHICLDITPAFHEQNTTRLSDILSPGKLINVGNADIHTGGAVANTGLAMKILGADVHLVSRIGNDEFGNIISSIVGKYDVSMSLNKCESDTTSYSVVLAVPENDRIFLHNPGANDTFCFEDIPMGEVKGASLFHFGYPSLMKKMYEDSGRELVKIFKTVKETGCATSLDLAAVDPNTNAGRADWTDILSKVLPYTDIFVPSIEEIMFMLDRDKFRRLNDLDPNTDFTEKINIQEDVIPIAEKCHRMGAKIILLKCGSPGMYYSTSDIDRMREVGKNLVLDLSAWSERSGFMRSYKPERIRSGTGAGDTSIAAFLTAILRGCDPETSVRYAACTGACCVSEFDALSGLKSFKKIDEMLLNGWEQTNE